LEKTGKINSEKLRAVFEYLVDEFPTCSIGHRYIDFRNAEVFNLHIGKRRCDIAVSREFFEDNDTDKISVKLEKYSLTDYILKTDYSHILVTDKGLKFKEQ
jgi:hypothetical protein